MKHTFAVLELGRACKRAAAVAFTLVLSLSLCACSLSGQGEAATVGTESSRSETENAQTSVGTSESSLEATQSAEESQEESDSKAEETSEASTEENGAVLTVRPGEYFIEILADLSKVLDIPEAELLETAELMGENLISSVDWQRGDTSHRTFQMEGYIAPGEYVIPEGTTQEKAFEILLSGWDKLITEEMEAEAAAQGLTLDEVLIMASIVEYESSHDPTGAVKPSVAAVVRNRIEYPMALEMDVTVFYLQEALGEYRDKADYEAWYDTYETSTLPAGAINSPSVESLEAVLHPAETNDLFFIYDSEGNYYFAEDYETHLANVEKYLD